MGNYLPGHEQGQLIVGDQADYWSSWLLSSNDDDGAICLESAICSKR
jgi:hypothetical protein